MAAGLYNRILSQTTKPYPGLPERQCNLSDPRKIQQYISDELKRNAFQIAVGLFELDTITKDKWNSYQLLQDSDSISHLLVPTYLGMSIEDFTTAQLLSPNGNVVAKYSPGSIGQGVFISSDYDTLFNQAKDFWHNRRGGQRLSRNPFVNNSWSDKFILQPYYPSLPFPLTKHDTMSYHDACIR